MCDQCKQLLAEAEAEFAAIERVLRHMNKQTWCKPVVRTAYTRAWRMHHRIEEMRNRHINIGG